MLAPDTVLQNRYHVIRKIGQGGMGAVYEAVDLRFNNTVALKENLVAEDSLTKAFEREARTLNALRHAALPVVIDYFSEGNGLFLIMQFIPGDDLGAILEKRKNRVQPMGVPKPFELDEVMSWAEQLLDVLDYLHTQQPPIIHRDIKPQNVKLTGRSQIVLLDFGLAKGTASQMSQVVSNASVFGYTPVYAPLEQMNSEGTDARSDLYSLAATLYHLLTGVAPINALARVTALTEGRPDPLPPINHLNPQIPAAVANVLWGAMSLSREARPANAAALRRLLQTALQAGGLPLVPSHIAPQGQETAPQNQTTTPARTAATMPPPGFPSAASPQPLSNAPTVQPPPLAQSTPAWQAGPIAQPSPAPKARAFWRWVGVGVAALLVAAIAAYLALQSSNQTPPAMVSDTASASKSRTSPTPLATRELFGRGRAEEAFYRFKAGPGEVSLTLNVIGNGGNVMVEFFDAQEKKLLLSDSRETFSVWSAGNHNEQGSATVYLERQQDVVMRLAQDYPDSITSYRLRLAGQLDSSLKSPSTGDQPLAAPFAPRDNPTALAAKEIVGRSKSEDVYYTFIAGPGDVQVELSVIGNGAGVGAEIFDEESKKIGFADGNDIFKLFSRDRQDERARSQFYLEKEQKVLLRVSQDYASSLFAYRVQLSGAIKGDLTEKSGDAWAEKFAMRDAPLPLITKEISGRSQSDDVYYEFWAGPGEVGLQIEVLANGAAVSLELFDANLEKVKFPDTEEMLKVWARENQTAQGSVRLMVPTRQKLVMRLHQEYPDGMKSYRLQVNGAIEVGKP